ncbi:hypothetical protein B0F90DRAFT_1686126 [Multifurca ochricompacta]|uniref:Uncharacterized protein n=1 Tax=Multifurca ochricompacta TaxID=376703 RepID=A0AAD4MBV7_9AGAM|nr:hypothetical protein B0F90DRAFT_1686126 [Multifurca ochricompacta]
MLSMSARDAKELRRSLNDAFEKLDQSRARASHAEKLAFDMLLRVREEEEEREKAMRDASAVREDLGRYKALLDSAHGEIRRAQLLLQDQEHLRYEAEASAARARDNARQMKQRRLVDLAREQGRKMGYNEGILAGQRIGFYESQNSGYDRKAHPNDGPRFREVFDEAKYQLDNFDQSPEVRLNLSTPREPQVILAAPPATQQVQPDLQAQHDGIPVPIPGVTTLPLTVPYTPVSPPRGVQLTPSADSSSTTTLPVAPTGMHISSRAPPPMPTIPEVANTEVGTVSWTPRSPRGSPSHIQIVLAPQALARPSILPPNVPLQSGNTFEPPPRSVEDVPSGAVNGHLQGSGVHISALPSPRRGFDGLSTASDIVIPGITRSPAQEQLANAQRHIPSPLQEQFTIAPGVLGRTPGPEQERFSAAHSPRVIRTHTESVQLAGELRNPERVSDRRGGPALRREGPPKRRPIPQMPAPLAPQSGPTVAYKHEAHSAIRRRRPSDSNNNMPRDTGFNATSDPGSHWRRPSPPVIPNFLESPRMDGQHTPSHRNSHEQHLDPGVSHNLDPATTPRFVINDPPPGQVPAPRLASSPAVYDQLLPTNSYSPRASSPSPDMNVSDLPHRLSPRYPPTLYYEPKLQQQLTTTVDYEQERRASSPVLPVPSRDRRGSARLIPPPGSSSRRGSYVAGQRAATDSPHTPADALPVPPPSMSPHPSPMAFPRQIPPPQGAATSSTPKRTTSPNPLPRGSSPAPLPRASSPPLPIRSPSMRSANVRRSASDVSLPGAPGSPYMRYNPNLEADIAVLASSSAEKLKLTVP